MIFIFFFPVSHFDWITTLKNWNSGGSPKYNFLLNDGVPPPWLYIGEKADNFGQSIWDNVWCYWELGEPLGNFMETHWEQESNQEIPPLPTPTCKKKNWAFLSLCKPSHWLREIFISKVVCHHFSPKLMESMEVLWVYICDSCYSNTFPSLALKCQKIILFLEIHFNKKKINLWNFDNRYRQLF